MYWPTSSAKRLHLSASGLDQSRSFLHFDTEAAQQLANARDEDEELLQLARSRNGMMWAGLSHSAISIWSARPAQVVAALVRTPQSLADYGKNRRLEWRPDARALLVETDESYLLIYHLAYRANGSIYSYIPPSGSGSKSRSGENLAPGPSSLGSSFAPGAGESAAAGDMSLGGLSGESCELRFRLVLRIDAGLRWASCTETHMLVSTTSPPAIQCIRWPDDDPDAPPPNPQDPTTRTRTTLVSSLPWVVQAEDQTAPTEITEIVHSRPMDMFVLLASDGRAYAANLDVLSESLPWTGKCFHGTLPRRPSRTVPNASDADTSDILSNGDTGSEHVLAPEQRGNSIAINAKFSLIAVGLEDGTVSVYNYRAPGRTPLFSHTVSVRHALKSTASYLSTGPVRSMSWTSDGYALAVGWERGVSVWSTYGKLMGCTLREDWELASKHFSDTFMFGARSLFWGPGNTELYILSLRRSDRAFQADNQLFVLPFAKSAVAGQHSPDNTRYAFFQTDDSVHVYRGADQPDMSIITPESDVWQHIKVPQSYLAANWPIRHAAISGDGNLIAIAGRRGLAHFSTSSGRWKTHKSIAQEQSFLVRGGLQWFQHVLIAACDAGGEYQLRLYSRDADLDSAQLLDLLVLSSPVVLTSLFDNSLLVYTADNTFYHFLIDLTPDRIRLRLCGSITFQGVVGEPARVRGMSWMIPESQQRFGDPVNDLTVATIIFLIDGKLVLLRPRRGAARGHHLDPADEDDDVEMAYDMQILADKIEYYWTHLQGIGTLENSLWGYDGSCIKLWLDALRIAAPEANDLASGSEDEDEEEYKTIESSVSMPLDFYPLCVLLEKGIVVGIESEVSLRKSLDFAMWRTGTNTHLFLHQILRNYLEKGLLEEAVFFASSYQNLVYFAHALEILLHAVLEDEADAGMGDALYSRKGSGSMLQKERSMSSLLADIAEDHLDLPHAQKPKREMQNSSGQQSPVNVRSPSKPTLELPLEQRSRAASNVSKVEQKPILPLVVEFLDHFPEALEVVVGCARKTEVARWAYLFDVVGAPLSLYQKCIEADQLRTAGMYLLVLHNLEPLDVSIAYTISLLKLCVEKQEWAICKDLLRFLSSIDPSGGALKVAVDEAQILHAGDGQLQRPTALLLRTTSAPVAAAPATPTKLDTMMEEDEEAESASFVPDRPGVGIRSKSASLPLAVDSPSRQIPDLTINGQALSPRLAAMGIGTGLRGQVRHGVGLSLSRVGLRSSADRIWDQPISPTSPLSQLPSTD